MPRPVVAVPAFAGEDRPAGLDAIAGAALDVFWDEPLPADHPLWTLPNVLVSPHMAGDFEGWRAALIAQFVANLGRWTAGETLDNVVDKAAGYPRAVVEPAAGSDAGSER